MDICLYYLHNKAIGRIVRNCAFGKQRLHDSQSPVLVAEDFNLSETSSFATDLNLNSTVTSTMHFVGVQFREDKPVYVVTSVLKKE